jgi:hypothetical protein
MTRSAAVAATLAGAALPAMLLAAGCGPSSSVLIDSYPIPLARAPMGGGLPGDGALLATWALPGASPDPTVPMVVDTGSAVTLLQGPPPGDDFETFTGGFDVFDASVFPPSLPPLRASFRGLDLLSLPLQPVGDGSIMPGAVMGGTLLLGYSVELRFGGTCTVGGLPTRCSSITFWNHLGADDGFLEDAGYAVYNFSLFGGGEVTAQGPPDFLGLRGPLVLPATRVTLRTCAVPAAFAPDDPIVACCAPSTATQLATGVNLSLLLATGVGPVILSASAFARVALASPTPIPAPTTPTASLFVATWPTAISAGWSSIPRLAFVNLETGPATDPGACVELGRARRTEQVSFQRANNPQANTCFQPCDADPREPTLAQSSAAYLELGGQIPVAVVSDDEPFLQALRFDVRPEGPELDGLVGAGALGRSRVEIDYLSSQPRALFSCEEDAPRAECWAAARCPRLPDTASVHYCFELPAEKLPAMCAPSGCP